MSARFSRGLALSLVALAACPSQRPLPSLVRASGIEVRRVDALSSLPYTPRAGVVVGDYVLVSGAMRAAVAAVPRSANSNVAPGSVLHLSLPDHPGIEDDQQLDLIILAGERELPLAGLRFETTVVEQHPAVRLLATARTPAGATLRVQRDYWLDPRFDALVVSTRLEHVSGPAVPGVAFGARLDWRAHVPFAPEVGALTDVAPARAAWVGRTAQHVSFGWAQWSGALTLRSVADRHADVSLSGHTDATSDPRELLPGRAITHQGLVAALPGDLAGIARMMARVRGEPVVDASVQVTGAGPGVETTVSIEREDGHVVLVARMPDARSRALPLPEGEYVAHATAAGHAPADPVRFVAREHAAPVALVIPAGGRIRFLARDAESNRRIPVRLVVAGIAGTRDPQLGPSHRAAGAENIVVAVDGRGEITVPPGRYELTFSRGPEWSIAQARTEVTGTYRGDVSVRLSHVLPMTDWTACDLHVHARPSFDSQVSVEDRVASLVVEGIEFATPTEHNIVGNYGPGVAALPATATTLSGGVGLLWVPAVEVTTDRARDPIGHFNVYPYVPDPEAQDGAPPAFQDPPRQIFRTAHANNPDAIVQVNHPRMNPGIGYFSAVNLDVRRNRAASRLYSPEYDAIEIFNGFYLNAIPSVEAVMHDWFALLGSGARYVGTASSDSHFIAYHGAGYPRTYVYTPIGDNAAPDAAAVLRGLHAGHAFGTSGPMLFLESNGALPGDTVRTTEPEVSFVVRAMAAPWIDVDSVEIYQDGALAQTLAVAPSTNVVRLEQTVTLPFRGARSFVVAVARGRRPMDAALPHRNALPFAFTNPIFLERGR